MEYREGFPSKKKVGRKKIGRQNFLRGGGKLALGTAVAAALGAIGVRVGTEGGLPHEEDYKFGRGKLFGKELSEARGLTLEKTDKSWPIIRNDPDPSGSEKYTAPGTKTRGVEVYGAMYGSGTAFGEVNPKEDPNHPYGIWVRLEDLVPIYKQTNEGDYELQKDEHGQPKMETGYVSENFVSFEKDQSENP